MCAGPLSLVIRTASRAITAPSAGSVVAPVRSRQRRARSAGSVARSAPAVAWASASPSNTSVPPCRRSNAAPAAAKRSGGRVSGEPERDLGCRAARARGAELRQRRRSRHVMAAFWIGQRGIQPAGTFAGADEAGGRSRAEQQREWVRVNARSLHLDGEVESLGLHLLEKAGAAAGVEELLGDAGEAGERDHAVQVGRAQGELAEQWQGDDRDLSLGQRGAQGAEGWHGAQKIADAR